MWAWCTLTLTTYALRLIRSKNKASIRVFKNNLEHSARFTDSGIRMLAVLLIVFRFLTSIFVFNSTRFEALFLGINPSRAYRNIYHMIEQAGLNLRD